MANVLFSSLTVPTPEPYDSGNPNKQRENFFYVLNQAIVLGKNEGWELPGPLEFWQALNDLQFQGVILDGGGVKILMTRKNTVIGG